MCQEKALLQEFGDEVVLCCDDHLTPGFHFDKLQHIEWRVPGTSVPARPKPPTQKIYVNKEKPAPELIHA